MTKNTSEYLDGACKAALTAGQHLQMNFGKAVLSRYKSERDPVTHADIEAEKIILEILSQEFPDHGFLSEELGQQKVEKSFRWIIDPLDGTMNFLHGLTDFGVSIALQVGGISIVGVVYQPMEEKLFTAVKGHGAYLNKEKLKVSSVTNLSESLFGTGFSASPTLRTRQYLLLKDAILQCGAIREPGSAALGLCNVACGIYDGYGELGLQLWDIAAGLLIVMEAGGAVTHLKGALCNNQAENILVSNGLLHQALLNAYSLQSEANM